MTLRKLKQRCGEWCLGGRQILEAGDTHLRKDIREWFAEETPIGNPDLWAISRGILSSTELGVDDRDPSVLVVNWG